MIQDYQDVTFLSMQNKLVII